jgi:MFS superfamily sulfate permease-like transporter
MQNDAKLGLLAGVVGVIIAATISGKTPSPVSNASGPAAGTSPQTSSTVKTQVKATEVSAPAVVPGELGTTAVARTRNNEE